jgi:hypothetical protein
MSNFTKTKFSAKGAIALLSALLYLSGCGGGMLGSGGRGSNSNVSSPFGSSGQTQKSPTGSTQTRSPTGGTSGPNTGYDQALQICDQYRDAAFKIQNACGGFFQQYLEEFSSGCRTRFQDLYNNDCNGLKERLQGVFNACSTDISEGMSYFPANCQQVLRQYVR